MVEAGLEGDKSSGVDLMKEREEEFQLAVIMISETVRGQLNQQEEQPESPSLHKIVLPYQPFRID